MTIHEMFVDLANLVEMQGEMVDRIEDHIMGGWLGSRRRLVMRMAVG